jgi:hypothetical protein
MKTRNGKIARLPKKIREELNHRLEDGCTGPQLVEWLNGLPEVQELLEAEFNNQPVNETNLTHWRQGGFLDWLRHEEMQDQLHLMLERSSDLEEEDSDNSRLCDQIARVANLELACQIQQLNAIEDPDKRWKKFQELSRELCRLQKGAQYARHVQLDWNRWEAEENKREITREEKRVYYETLMPFFQQWAAKRKEQNQTELS